VTADNPRHAALYLRISRDSTGEGLGVERQRADALKLAELRGWPVALIETDNDISAAGKKRRPGFEAIMSAVEKGEVQAVIAWDMTRLTRNLRDLVRIIEAGERHKTVLAFVRGDSHDLSTPNGRMIANILASVARQEIEQKADRQRAATRQAADQGRWIGGRRPFGYEKDGVTIRENEAAAIRQAYDAVLVGVPLAQIARDWNAAGLWTPQQARKEDRKDRPSQWVPSATRGVLMNPRYAGLRGHGSVPEHGRRKIEVAGPAKWPGIISEETWRAVVGLLSDPARFTAKNSGGRNLLTGIALCGVCGATVNAGGSNRPGHRIYRCSATWGHVVRAALPVEKYVGEVVIARLSRPDAADLLRDDKRPDIDALRSEAMAMRARLDQLATDWADGAMTSSQLRTATSRLRSKLALTESRMADAGRVDVLGPLVLAGDVRAVWEALSTARQRVVIDALMIIKLMPPGQGRRTFRPETVIITPRM
jgi:DNA invertase Pin-like site-specific DNA recombinase